MHSFRRMRLVPLLLLGAVVSACGSESSDAVNLGDDERDPFERGGDQDLSRCEDDDDAPTQLHCRSAAGAPSFALAVCGDLQADNTLGVDPRADAAVVAVDGASTTAAPLTVHGSFTSFGSIEARNTQDVDGTLSTAGDLVTAAPVRVGGDVLVGGALSVRNTFSVGGTLQAAPGSDTSNVTGTVQLGPVQVPRALRCADAADVRAMVDAAWPGPDDGSYRGEAVRVTQPTRVTLGCGTYRFESLQVDNTLDVRIAGNTVILIDHDLRVAAPTHFTVDPGATLEIVVGGALQADNTLDVGSVAREDATWLAVAGNVRVAAPMHVYGALFVPRGTIAADNTLDVWGPAFVGPLRVASPVAIHDGVAMDAAGCLTP